MAVLEFSKGAAVLPAGCGLLALVHRDVQGLVESLVGRLHLTPAKGYPIGRRMTKDETRTTK